VPQPQGYQLEDAATEDQFHIFVCKWGCDKGPGTGFAGATTLGNRKSTLQLLSVIVKGSGGDALQHTGTLTVHLRIVAEAEFSEGVEEHVLGKCNTSR
jgi:hypothetical protein